MVYSFFVLSDRTHFITANRHSNRNSNTNSNNSTVSVAIECMIGLYNQHSYDRGSRLADLLREKSVCFKWPLM